MDLVSLSPKNLAFGNIESPNFPHLFLNSEASSPLFGSLCGQQGLAGGIFLTTLRNLGLTVLCYSEQDDDGLMVGDYDLRGLFPP